MNSSIDSSFAVSGGVDCEWKIGFGASETQHRRLQGFSLASIKFSFFTFQSEWKSFKFDGKIQFLMIFKSRLFPRIKFKAFNRMRSCLRLRTVTSFEFSVAWKRIFLGAKRIKAKESRNWSFRAKPIMTWNYTFNSLWRSAVWEDFKEKK